MAIHIDLNTHIIPKDRSVWVARPGRSYRLYHNVIDSGLMLVDLPHLDLQRGLPLDEQPDLDRRIQRSRALRAWYRRPDDKKKPSLDLKTYPSAPSDRSVAQLRGVLAGYFDKSKVGDLVIVPPSAYSRPALIGEIVGRPTEYVRHKVASLYGDDPLTGRRVKWVAEIEKRRLPTAILDALEKPIAFFILERSLRPTIYDAAYGTYVDFSADHTEFIARFFVSSETYTTSSDFRLQAFFNFVAANTKAVETGQAPKGLLEAAFADLGNYAPELKTNVNSPGFLTLVSKYSVPLIAAVLLALAIEVGPDALQAAMDGKIVIGNSKAPPGDPCTAGIIETTLTQMKLLKLTEWPQACEVARMAAEQSGVTGTVRIEQKP